MRTEVRQRFKLAISSRSNLEEKDIPGVECDQYVILSER